MLEILFNLNEGNLMPINIKINEDDYILYEILCDYCDEEYTIKYMMKDRPKHSIECCPFCSNLIEEPAESVNDEETGWD
jgi:hypothetical protein